MSAQFGNAERAERIAALEKARLAEGQCTYCKPHRGENHHSHDGRFIDGRFVRSKDKDRK